jgi:hypothetical protein
MPLSSQAVTTLDSSAISEYALENVSR